MDSKTKKKLANLYNFGRKSRYTSELKKIDGRLNFYWNNYVGKWAIFQNNKLIRLCESEREGINTIKYIFGFHRQTANSNKKVEQMFAENLDKQEKHRDSYMDDVATEMGERFVVALNGSTPTFKMGS